MRVVAGTWLIGLLNWSGTDLNTRMLSGGYCWSHRYGDFRCRPETATTLVVEHG